MSEVGAPENPQVPEKLEQRNFYPKKKSDRI